MRVTLGIYLLAGRIPIMHFPRQSAAGSLAFSNEETVYIFPRDVCRIIGTFIFFLNEANLQGLFDVTESAALAVFQQGLFLTVRQTSNASDSHTMSCVSPFVTNLLGFGTFANKLVAFTAVATVARKVIAVDAFIVVIYSFH